MEVNGTLVWYYNMCKREVWLMSHSIIPNQQDENIEIGKFIHEQSYSRNDKEIQFGNVKFDVLMNSNGKILIGETKKTSKFQNASKWQLLFYLKVLKEAGIQADGVLLYPEEKKRVPVVLDDENERKLAEMIEEIEAISSSLLPPPKLKKALCKTCGYNEYCYA